MKKYFPFILILLILFFDQLSKIYIKTHWMIGEEYKITDWFIIHFTENNGMAFGMEFGGSTGKFLLSSFRIIAISFIGYYLIQIIKKDNKPIGYTIGISLIFSGAIGNILDSLFYGQFFTDSYYQVAQLFPEKGYADFLYGKVVDMLYFPIINTHFPDWVPFWGNESFVFFRPVFNIADASITIGISIILIFYRSIILK